MHNLSCYRNKKIFIQLTKPYKDNSRLDSDLLIAYTLYDIITFSKKLIKIKFFDDGDFKSKRMTETTIEKIHIRTKLYNNACNDSIVYAYHNIFQEINQTLLPFFTQGRLVLDKLSDCLIF